MAMPSSSWCWRTRLDRAMTLHTDPAARWAHRVAELATLFSTIAHTRMAGVPVLNASLRVEAIGFERPLTGDVVAPVVGVGVLVTPWFMNLVRLPMRYD